MTEIIKSYTLGDMQAVYVLNKENKNPELVLLPAGMAYRESRREKPYPDALVQVKIVGDVYPGGYAGGRSLRQGKSVEGFCYERQNVLDRTVVGRPCSAF